MLELDISEILKWCWPFYSLLKIWTWMLEKLITEQIFGDGEFGKAEQAMSWRNICLHLQGWETVYFSRTLVSTYEST